MTKEEKIAMLQRELEDLRTEEPINEEMIEDADFTEVPQEEVPEEEPGIVTLIHLGYKEDGSLLFSVEGEANLLAIEGLLKYADREMKRVWEQRSSENPVEE